MVACPQGSAVVQKSVKISRIFKFGVQLWLTRIWSDIVTAQVYGSIILESSLMDTALYPYADGRSGRLMDQLQNRTFWPIKYQISTKLSPNLTDYCGWAVHAHAFIFTASLGMGGQGRHRKLKVHIINGWLSTGLRCRSKMFSNFKNIQLWRPAVTDTHKVWPCNCTGWSPDRIGIDAEWFSPVSISRWEIWPFDGPPSE